MNIIYIGKHGNTRRSNDDEGAITYALEELGHEVHCVQEGAPILTPTSRRTSLILFNHWADPSPLQDLRAAKACWCFDLIDYPKDATLESRNRRRSNWAQRAVEASDIAFFTDGDWVAADTTGKVHHLSQGCDQTALPCAPKEGRHPPLLLTGISAGGGRGRESFTNDLTARYREQLLHIRSGVHGRPLAQTIAGSTIVIAPDSPLTDRYWSNRVYLTLGLGGFLLHPFSEGLAREYVEGKELVFYRGREDLYRLIDYYLDPSHSEEREAIRSAGYIRTHTSYTYRHRCEKLIALVRERLGVL